jgi:hypothetical protein
MMLTLIPCSLVLLQKSCCRLAYTCNNANGTLLIVPDWPWEDFLWVVAWSHQNHAYYPKEVVSIFAWRTPTHSQHLLQQSRHEDIFM